MLPCVTCNCIAGNAIGQRCERKCEAATPLLLCPYLILHRCNDLDNGGANLPPRDELELGNDNGRDTMATTHSGRETHRYVHLPQIVTCRMHTYCYSYDIAMSIHFLPQITSDVEQ
jgi:hypothetical protein